MSQFFHVYYRTQGMAHLNESGWRRADVLAESADDAVSQVAAKHRLLFARVYAGSDCTATKVEWSYELVLRHVPHEIEDVPTGKDET